MNKRTGTLLLLILLILGGSWYFRDYLKKLPLFTSLFGGFQQESVVTTSGLVAYYPMERNGNTLYDYSRYTHDGTATSITSAPGKKGTAASFNGTTSTVNAGTDWIGTGNITVSAWIYANTPGEGGFGRILSNGRFELYEENSGGAQRFKVTSDGSSSSYSTNSSAVFGAWQHILVTRNSAGTNYFYINGVDRTNNTGSGTPATATTNVTIGNNSGLYTFDGLIDELRVYDRVLTTEEITQLYRDGNQTIGGGDKGLIAHYPLASEGQVFQGTDLISGWDFTSGWTTYNATINSATQFTISGAGNGYVKKSGYLAVGSRYTMTIAGTVSIPDFSIWNYGFNSAYKTLDSTSFNTTFTFTAVTDTGFLFKSSGAGTVITITSMTLRQEQTADATPNSRHGTITAGSGAFTTDRHGQANKAYDFDGANTKIATGADYIGVGNISVSAWIYLDSYGQLTVGRLIANGQITLSVTNETGLARLKVNSDNSLTLAYSANNSILTGNWYHVVITRAIGATAPVNFYINGVLSGTANQASATAGPVAGTTNVIIGNVSAGDRTFDGRISDLRIYNRVLSTTEITRLYDAYSPRVSINGLAKGLIGHWELTQKWSNGTAIQDLTPNNYTGTASSVTVGGRASDFDGANSKIDLGADVIGTGADSISAWIYADGLGEGTNGRILDNGKTEFAIESGPRLFFSSNVTNYAYSANISLGAWYHVVVTRNAFGTANYYVNGVLSGSANQASGTPAAGTTNVIVGNNNGQTGTWDGRISDVRLYDHVLSSTEITQLYNMGRPRASDRATDLNGTTQYFTLADGAGAGDDMEPGTSDVLLETWVDADAFAANQILVGKTSDVTGSTSLYGMYLNTSARLVGKIADADSAVTSTDDGTALTANKWYHLAVAFDRDGNMTRYVDGVAYGTTSSIAGEASSITNAVAFSVGAESDGGLPLNGQVDGVRVYKFSSGLPTNLSAIMSYNAEVKGRIHPDIAASLVDGWDFDGEAWARTTAHNLTNNGTATFVKP